MRGQNLAIFLEPFKQTVTQGMGAMGLQNQVSYEPIDTGLEKLLAHWGLRIGQSIVMDEACYTQALNQSYGGGETSIHYIPIIQPENIDPSLSMMRNLKELYALKVSPLFLDEETLAKNELKATVAFSSSERAWEMEAPINLDPLYLSPPSGEEAFGQKTLAALVEGPFPSYFADKGAPEKPADDTEEKDDDDSSVQEEALQDNEDEATLADRITSDIDIIEKGKPATVFLIGSGDMLMDNLLNTASTPNSMFIMNMIDTLNDREDIALMRSKSQSHNPLDKTKAGVKTAIKAVNIICLPVLVALFGMIVWFRRHVRKKMIQGMFDPHQGAAK
jgi:ABC-type uncharacterized transport system involved in gliding motility auxiliary subunit